MTAGEIIGRDITRDKTGDKCAACGQGGDYHLRRQMGSVVNWDGRTIPVMLCIDAAACCRRYRHGLTPTGYGTMLKRGVGPVQMTS